MLNWAMHGDETRASVARLFKDGLSYSEIGRALGLKRSQVAGIVNRMRGQEGMPPARPKMRQTMARPRRSGTPRRPPRLAACRAEGEDRLEGFRMIRGEGRFPPAPPAPAPVLPPVPLIERGDAQCCWPTFGDALAARMVDVAALTVCGAPVAVRGRPVRRGGTIVTEVTRLSYCLHHAQLAGMAQAQDAETLGLVPPRLFCDAAPAPRKWERAA
jgi:hypothetical protein